MKCHRKFLLLQLSLLIASVSACHPRLDMEEMLADNPRESAIHRRDTPTYYEEGDTKHVINSRGGHEHHVVYEEGSTPKTVIILQPQAPLPQGAPFPSLLPNFPKHFHKHLQHATKFLRHRMKKLHKFFRDFLGDEPPPPHLPPPIPVAVAPIPPPLKIGVPAIKVEAYEEEPPKIVKVVHHHHPHEPLVKYVESPKVVKVVESYGPPPPKEVIQYVKEPLPPPPPKEIVTYVSEPPPVVKYVKSHHHHHHHHPEPPPLPPPAPTKVVTKYVHEPPPPPPPPTKVVRVVETYEREPPPPPPPPPPNPPERVVRYEESYEPDGTKVIRVIKENPYPRRPDGPPPPYFPPPEPTAVPRRHHHPEGPPLPVPTPTAFIHPDIPKPEPVIYSKGASGSFQPTPRPYEVPDIRTASPQPIFHQTPTPLPPQPTHAPTPLPPHQPFFAASPGAPVHHHHQVQYPGAYHQQTHVYPGAPQVAQPQTQPVYINPQSYPQLYNPLSFTQDSSSIYRK